jgi:hypothetical protein
MKGAKMLIARFALPALVLAGFTTTSAFADGDYTGRIVYQAGESAQCAAHTPPETHVSVRGTTVTVGDHGCVAQLSSDGKFSCRFRPAPEAAAQWTGRVSASAVDAIFQMTVTLPPLFGGGFKCRGTLKATAS